MALARSASSSSLNSASSFSLNESTSTAPTSRPTSPAPSVGSSASGSGSRRLPIRLPRPSAPSLVDDDVVCSAAGIEGVPGEYVRKQLAAIGVDLLRATAGAQVVLSSSSARISLPTGIPTQHRPSHVLALTEEGSTDVLHLPVHGLVYALAASSLCPLAAPSSLPPPCTSSSSFDVPILPLVVPSVALMPTLNTYLVTRRSDVLVHDLLPSCGAADDAERGAIPAREIAGRIAATVDAVTVRRSLARVYGLWSNVVALGGFVEDGELWSTLDSAWTVVLAALAMQQGEPAMTCL